MSRDLENLYQTTGRNFSKLALTWKILAKIDAKLTDRWIDCEDKKSHKIFVDDLLPENEVNFEVSRFLGNEYRKSLESVSYELVSYFPSDSFLQLGMFAKNDITKGSIIEGVVGVLAEIRDDEVIAGLNDVYILCSRLRDMQWLMLGPISFVNASYKSNIEYRQKGRIVYCVAIKDISMGQELTVFYYRHFFGSTQGRKKAETDRSTGSCWNSAKR